jgi:hypothetical protein
MQWYEWALLTAVLMLIFTTLIISYFIARGAYHPSHFSFAHTRAKEMERTPDLLAEYDKWEKIPYILHSRFGYDLKCYYLPLKNGEETNRKFVVIAHGYTYTHHGSIKYAWLMKQLGFNVILYDERYHGDSGGKTCTLGYYEQFDLEDIITDTFFRYGPHLFLGTYGESMGASTVLLEQAFDKRLKFVVADCAFADFSMLVESMIRRRFHLPKFPFLPLADIFFRLATKVSMQKIKPKTAVLKATQPVLFIHGKADGFIPCIHSQILYDACPSPKALFLAGNDAKHAESFRKNREEYTKVLFDFMNESVLNVPQKDV